MDYAACQPRLACVANVDSPRHGSAAWQWSYEVKAVGVGRGSIDFRRQKS